MKMSVNRSSYEKVGNEFDLHINENSLFAKGWQSNFTLTHKEWPIKGN